MTEQKKEYLTQRELFEEIIKCRIDGQISNKLGSMFMKLSSKVANHYKFVRYIHIREDLIAAGAMACCKAFEKFHPYKDKDIDWDEETPIEYDYLIHSNSFAYMTSSIWNAFLQVLKREYKFSNVVNASRIKEGYDASFGYTDMIAEQEEELRQNRIDEGDFDEVAPHLAEERLWDDNELASILDKPETDDNGIEW